MPVGVVDALQVVHVHVAEAERRSVALRPRQLLPQPFGEGARVGQSGERVGPGEALGVSEQFGEAPVRPAQPLLVAADARGHGPHREQHEQPADGVPQERAGGLAAMAPCLRDEPEDARSQTRRERRPAAQPPGGRQHRHHVEERERHPGAGDVIEQSHQRDGDHAQHGQSGPQGAHSVLHVRLASALRAPREPAANPATVWRASHHSGARRKRLPIHASPLRWGGDFR